jgi:hypothetical protein
MSEGWMMGTVDDITWMRTGAKEERTGIRVPAHSLAVRAWRGWAPERWVGDWRRGRRSVFSAARRTSCQVGMGVCVLRGCGRCQVAPEVNKTIAQADTNPEA